MEIYERYSKTNHKAKTSVEIWAKIWDSRSSEQHKISFKAERCAHFSEKILDMNELGPEVVFTLIASWSGATSC